MTQFTVSHSLFGIPKYSYLKGQDISNVEPLIFMPPNNLFGSLTYRVHNSIKLSENIKMEDSEIEISNRLVIKQGNINAEQDFVAPPPSYHLLGLTLSSNIVLLLLRRKQRFHKR